MKKVRATFILTCCILILVGCFPRQTGIPERVWETWTYNSISNPIVNKDYVISITPEYWSSYRKGYGWHCFILSLANKMNRNIEIVWDKTLFITNGATSGRFMFEGVVYRDRNNPKPNDIVFGNTTFTKLILPNNLVEYIGSFGRSLGLGWFHNIIPQGENGIYITMKVDDKEISEKVTVNIRKE